MSLSEWGAQLRAKARAQKAQWDQEDAREELRKRAEAAAEREGGESPDEKMAQQVAEEFGLLPSTSPKK